MLKLKEYVDDGRLVLRLNILFSFLSESNEFKLVKPAILHDITPSSENLMTALVMTVTHQDEDLKNWTHDVFALVCERKIYYFDFNEFEAYIKPMRKFLTQMLPRYTFHSVFSHETLFPQNDLTGYIAIQQSTYATLTLILIPI